MRRLLAFVSLLGLATAATLTKKNSYGGDPSYVASAPSYGVASGAASSYDPSASYGTGGVSSDSASGSAYGNSASATSYGGGAAPSSYGGGSDGYSGSNSADSYGNLYYYYYPVTNHSGASSYNNAGGGGGGYGGNAGGGGGGGGGGYGSSGSGSGSYGSGSYYPMGPSNYPMAPINPGGYNDPLGGLLSVISSVDINSLILPILLIGGVALLLPAILNCDLELGTCVIPLPGAPAGRRRRDAADFELQQITLSQMVQHAYNIYEAVQESEQCMERVVCEVGGMMQNIRGKETVFSVLEHFASQSMLKQLRVLKEGALPITQDTLTSSDAASSCHKFVCGKLSLTSENKID